MKTRIIFSVILTVLLLPMNLQGQVKFGIHAGLNLETQAELGHLWDNCELYPGYLAGGSLEYDFGKGIVLQAELNYQKKGEKVNSTLAGASVITKRDFNYLSVPLLLRKNVKAQGLGERWDLTFFAGPYAGYLLSAQSRETTGNITEKVNIDSQAEKSDLGVLFGGGTRYKLGNGSYITAELRYGMGLSKIDKQDPDLRNKSMGITIGYSF